MKAILTKSEKERLLEQFEKSGKTRVIIKSCGLAKIV